MEANRSPAITKRVVAQVSEGVCLNCRAAKMKKRGLCTKCASVWEYQMLKLPSAKARRKYEAELISDGKLLAAQEIRTLKAATNKLVELARKVASTA